MENPNQTLPPAQVRSGALGSASALSPEQHAAYTAGYVDAVEQIRQSIIGHCRHFGKDVVLADTQHPLDQSLCALLPRGLVVVQARAYVTDEEFGYDRWKADQFSLGRGTHEAFILILPNIKAEQRPLTK